METNNNEIELLEACFNNSDPDNANEDNIRLTNDVALLYLISEIYEIPFMGLLLLYEEIDQKIWLVFYLFSGIKVNFPSEKKFIKLIHASKDVVVSLAKPATKVKLPPKVAEVKLKLETIYDSSDNTIKVDYNEYSFEPMDEFTGIQ